ncbi:hypothetical protein RTBOTA2_002148, partial [Rhodotorula toruloides]
ESTASQASSNPSSFVKRNCPTAPIHSFCHTSSSSGFDHCSSTSSKALMFRGGWNRPVAPTSERESTWRGKRTASFKAAAKASPPAPKTCEGGRLSASCDVRNKTKKVSSQNNDPQDAVPRRTIVNAAQVSCGQRGVESVHIDEAQRTQVCSAAEVVVCWPHSASCPPMSPQLDAADAEVALERLDVRREERCVRPGRSDQEEAGFGRVVGARGRVELVVDRHVAGDVDVRHGGRDAAYEGHNGEARRSQGHQSQLPRIASLDNGRGRSADGMDSWQGIVEMLHARERQGGDKRRRRGWITR